MTGLHLTLKEKKALFLRICGAFKKSGLEGEEFLDAVYNEIEKQYDAMDPEYGLTMNEQWEFDKHCNKWLKEIA